MTRKKIIKKTEKITGKIIKEKELTSKKTVSNETNFIYAVGKRKTATARVRLYPQKTEAKEIIINQKKLEEYFPYFEYQKIINEPLKISGLENKFFITIKVGGGGKHSQAEAIRHGLSRLLQKYNPDLHKVLKAKGYLTRDSRMKERKKPGLKRARRAPQWQKR